MSNTKTEAQRLADGLLAETSKFGTPSIQRGLLNGAIQELRRLDAENKAMQTKLIDQKQTIYAFHYAMKDAGWHPGRTDDDLTDIIRQKGKELAEVNAERDQLRAQVEQAELERDEAQAKCQELSAQLVEAGHNEDAWRAQLSKAVAEEREACAALENEPGIYTKHDLAEAIRARSNT